MRPELGSTHFSPGELPEANLLPTSSGWGFDPSQLGNVSRSVESLEGLSQDLAEFDGWVGQRPRPVSDNLLHQEAPPQRSSAPQTGSEKRASAAEVKRWAALRQFGGFTLAYNTAVQDGLEYHWSSVGYLAFARRKGHVFVLGDPVTSASDLPKLLADFLAKYRRPTFVQISSETARCLEPHGYYVNEMGVDSVLDLPAYSFGGKAMERIRYASNWLKKHGYRITEETFASISPSVAESVSQSWRASMKYRRSEMRFLNRPIRFSDERDVRKFFLLDSTGQCVAFMYFDPLYRDGQVVGYATAIKRRSPEAPLYAEQGLMRAAVEKFQAEQKLQVNLGLSPLAWIENKTFRRNPFLHFSFRYAFRAWWVNRYFYNLEGHAQYKRHFKGREVPYHYASPVLFNDLRIMNLMRLTGIY
jgi:phosphatidylglycerol lysyltransferase